jgi:hypothetical protein
MVASQVGYRIINGNVDLAGTNEYCKLIVVMIEVMNAIDGSGLWLCSLNRRAMKIHASRFKESLMLH